ncbi:MAG: pyrroline-5-carboxylate reductase dimerization domain-containing protein [Methanobacteriaceae archaeon]|nr:pyrroline-5-carboxylate reductase dimerization domain-containing protein [Methanobacteriaceae archaeon]
MKKGFIGYGSMGKMIINGLFESKAICQDNIIISTRTLHKLNYLKQKYPKIEITSNKLTLAKKCSTIFIFVNTGEVKNILDEIKDYLIKDVHIVHICAGLPIKTMEHVFNGKISRIIPSLTSEVNEGISLMVHNDKVSEVEKNDLECLFNNISQVKVISEEYIGMATDLTSCAPAFIAFMLMQMSHIGAEKSGISTIDAEEMMIKTFYGTAKLLHEKEMGFEELIARVSTPGGITAEGIKSLENDLPPAFNNLFKMTSNKRENLEKELDKQYGV